MNKDVNSLRTSMMASYEFSSAVARLGKEEYKALWGLYKGYWVVMFIVFVYIMFEFFCKCRVNCV